MSRSAITTRRILFVVAGLMAIGIPSIVANADDAALALGNGLDTFGAQVAPAMPGLPGDTLASSPALPALPAAVTTTVSGPVGSNPFQVASVSPAPVAAFQKTALGNPFAPVGGVAVPANVPDAAPFNLLAPTNATQMNQAAPINQPAAGIDVTALRYYAGQRDMARVGAEIRRLKALNPSWEPPVDLFVAPSTVDEQPLWDLFAQGDLAIERARIADLKVLNPTWTPSSDLIIKLEDAESRQAMRVAYNIGNWDQVVAIGQSRNAILVCSQIEALWQMGEALARLNNLAMSFEIYKYALVNCVSPQDRLSTVQKAASVLPQTGVRALVVLGRPLPDGTSEFDSIGFDDLRHRITAAINENYDADPVDPSEIDRFASYVRATRAPDDVGLIAWYYYSLEEWDAARAWFTVGSKLSKDPKFLEGQVLSLRSGGEIEPALKLANAVKMRSPELTKEYIELVSAILTDPESEVTLPDKDMSTFHDIVAKSKSALGAQAIGWTYVASNDLTVAKKWFDDSMDWDVTEGGVIGQAVIASRLKQYTTLSTLKASYGDQFAGLDDFKVYTVKVKAKSSRKAQTVTQASVECKTSSRRLGLFFRLACPPN